MEADPCAHVREVGGLGRRWIWWGSTTRVGGGVSLSCCQAALGSFSGAEPYRVSRRVFYLTPASGAGVCSR